MFAFESFAYLNPSSGLTAEYKAACRDFIVDEIMPVQPDGNGEHCWLHIRKTALNTEDVATKLAKFAGVKSVAVSYAGLKDKHAVTTQWFSVHLPGKADPDWSELQSNEFEILATQRHSRKLKRGALRGNRFTLRLRNCSGGDQSAWIDRLELVSKAGVPNYFGPQRFGHQMSNLVRASDLIEHNKLRRLNPHKRGIYLSAMRSWIFNGIVSERIRQNSYLSAHPGDVFMLADSQACFSEAINDTVIKRLEKKDIHLTAALWGKGPSMAEAEIERLENSVASQTPSFIQALEVAGMKQERRSMRLMPVNMQWQFDDDNCLVVSFELTKGSYATAILRELGNIRDVSIPVTGHVTK